MIDRITIEKIRDAARIEEVVGDFVTLRRAGANLKGLCPFHDDRTPSFFVSPSKNYCKCFACGEGGNPISFIMKHEQMTYPDALRYLAKKYGIEIKERDLTPEELQHNDDRESMFILNDWANKWFQHQLKDTEDGRAIGLSYFHGRGFRDDILEKFQVGFCPDNWQGPMSQDALKAGFQEKFLTNTPDMQDSRKSVGTGLSLKKDNGQLRDRFRGRVMWPIFTMSGRVAGFGGRVLDAATKGVQIKYQNSPESIVYSKRRELYGLYQAKTAISKKDVCYLVEGYTDVMAMHQSGVENVVASLGTSLTEEQIRLIHRLTNNIVVIYDGDAAGVKASQRGIDMLLHQGMSVKLLLLPDDDDPDSFSRKHTAQEFQDYLKQNQVDFIRFKTNLLMDEAKGDPMAMSRLINNIVRSIAVIPDEITRTLYIRESANMMNLQERLIGDAVSKQVAANTEEWHRQKDREKQKAERELPPAGIHTEEGAPTESTTEDSPVPVADENANLIAVRKQKAEQRFYMKERELVQLIVREGEKKVEAEAEDGSTIEIKVAELVNDILAYNEIKLRTPLFQKILEEAVEHCNDEGFVAEKYFLNIYDEKINSLAYDLVSDQEPLSKIHEKGKSKYVEEEPRSPKEMAMHLLNDYQLEIVKEQKALLKKQMLTPEVAGDTERFNSVAAQMKRLMEIEKNLRK